MQENEDLKVIMSTELGYGKEAMEKEFKDNLKKNFLGGYSKKSVFSYVERLKNTMEQMHASMEQQVSDLVREKTELVQETSLLRHQLNDSEDMAKKNQEQVSKLQQQCEELKNNAEKQALDDKEKELIFKELEEENDNYKKMEELLRIRMEEQDKLFEERRGLKLKIRDMEKETGRLETELNEKRKMCEEFEQRLNDAENLNPQMMELENKSGMENLENYRKEESAGSGENNNSKQEIKKKNEHIEQIRWQLEESKDALEFQLGRYRELEAENKILEQEKDMLRAQVYEAALRQRETEKEKQKNEALVRQTVQLEKEKAEVEEALMTMKELLEDMKNKETRISQEAEEEKAAYERLQQKFNLLYQQSQELRLQMKQLELERKASDTVLEKYQKQEKEYVLLKQNNERYLGEIKDLEESIYFMFDQMSEQAQSFQNLNDGYEDSKRKIQILLQEKTEIQLKNVELVEQINQLNQRLGQMDADVLNAGKQTSGVTANQAGREREWNSLELGSTGTEGSMEIKTVDIGEIKKRSIEMTTELRDKLNKQMVGM